MTMTANDQCCALDLGEIVALNHVDNVIVAEGRPTVFPRNFGTLFLDTSCDFFRDLGKIFRIAHRIVRQLTENDIGGHLAPPGASLWLPPQIPCNSLTTYSAAPVWAFASRSAPCTIAIYVTSVSDFA